MENNAQTSAQTLRYMCLKLVCENGSMADKENAIRISDTFYRYIMGDATEKKLGSPAAKSLESSNQKTGSGSISVRKESRKETPSKG